MSRSANAARRNGLEPAGEVCGRHHFPPLAELRARLDAGRPWATVAIDAKVSGEYRPGIRGPLSFFFNDSGFAEVSLQGRTLPLAPQTFALSPPGETFSLAYPEGHATRAINVYFADELVRDVLGDRAGTVELDAGPDTDTPLYDPGRPALRPIDAGFAAALDRVRANLDAGSLALEQAAIALLAVIVSRPAGVGVVPRLRPATQAELRRRVLATIDYLVAYSDQELTLGQLARICGLSKFHFLRIFHASTGSTPSRFLAQVRLDRAKSMLLRSDRSITEIALDVGFAEQSSFTRAFTRREGVSPRAFRRRYE
jgi:AraC-like DNA-binding protein